MRDSIWSAPGYADMQITKMEEGRPQSLLYKAFADIPGYTWNAKLQHCASCKCCMRHQTFRPNRLVRWDDDMADRDIKILWVNKICECDCRHMARFICRQVDIDGTTPACPIRPPTLEEDIA